MNSDGCLFLKAESWLARPEGYGYLDRTGDVGRVSLPGAGAYSLVATGRVVASEFNAVSDARVKEEVAEFRGCLDLVTRLGVRHYKYKPDGQYKVGVVAQEVEKVFPNCVSQLVRDDIPDFRVVDHSQLTALLLGAVQELSRRLERVE